MRLLDEILGWRLWYWASVVLETLCKLGRQPAKILENTENTGSQRAIVSSCLHDGFVFTAENASLSYVSAAPQADLEREFRVTKSHFGQQSTLGFNPALLCSGKFSPTKNFAAALKCSAAMIRVRHRVGHCFKSPASDI